MKTCSFTGSPVQLLGFSTLLDGVVYVSCQSGTGCNDCSKIVKMTRKLYFFFFKDSFCASPSLVKPQVLAVRNQAPRNLKNRDQQEGKRRVENQLIQLTHPPQTPVGNRSFTRRASKVCFKLDHRAGCLHACIACTRRWLFSGTTKTKRARQLFSLFWFCGSL